jgi:hypothetical protein
VTGDASDADDIAELLGERLQRYVDLWNSANAKLSAGTYHAEDLVDDWFRWVGLVARDATATATLIFGAVRDQASSERGSARE